MAASSALPAGGGGWISEPHAPRARATASGAIAAYSIFLAPLKRVSTMLNFPWCLGLHSIYNDRLRS